MPVDLSPYRINPNEKPASATKQDNTLHAIENALNHFPAAQIQGYPSDGTKFLNGAGGWTVPSVPAAGTTVLTKLSQKDVVNTVSWVDLLNGEIIIPANTMSATGAIKFWLNGDYLNNSGAQAAIRLMPQLGGINLWDPGNSDPLNQTPTRRGWYCHGLIQARGSISSQQGGGFFGLSYVVSGVTGAGGVTDPAGAGRMLITEFETITSAVPMNANQAFAFLATHSVANANISIRLDFARIEVT
jgi:hypothetical protein